MTSRLALLHFVIVSVLVTESGRAQEGERFFDRRYGVSASAITNLNWPDSEDLSYLKYTDNFQAGLKNVFESLGVDFPEGATIHFDFESEVLTVRNQMHQIQVIEALLDLATLTGETSLHVVVEGIEVEKTAWVDSLTENTIDSLGDSLREAVQNWIREERAKLVHTASVVTESGERGKSRSGESYTYPKYSKSSRARLEGAAKGTAVPGASLAFEHRDLGITFEVDPHLENDGETIFLNLSTQVVELAGFSEWPNSENGSRDRSRLPKFHTQEIIVQVSAKDGKSMLLGTSNPLETGDAAEETILLWFVRADVEWLDQWQILGDETRQSREPGGLVKLGDGLFQKTFYLPTVVRERADHSDPFGTPADSIATDASENFDSSNPFELPDPQKMLEDMGIVFPGNGLARRLPENGRLLVRTTEDQFERLDALLDIGSSQEKEIYVITEFIEIEKSDYADWLYKNRIARDGAELREAVDGWLGAGRGKVLDSSIVLARSGQRSRTRSVTEFIHPSLARQSVYQKPGDRSGGEIEASSATHAEEAVGTRELGLILEVDPVLSADGEGIYLALSPELSQLKGYTTWPSKDAPAETRIDIPTFHEMRVNSEVIQKPGRYGLLGTTVPLGASPGITDPLVLVFVRADFLTSE